MSLYVQVPIQQIADGLTAIGWSSGGGGGDASLTYSATAPASPINGTLWWDTTNTLLKIYTGGVWTTVNVSAETIASISTSVSQAQSAATSASNSASQALAAKNAITGMQVATGAAGSSVTWNGTTLTVPQGIQGIKGDTGVSITGIARTTGDGSAGTTDTYTIYYSDATTGSFEVYNGANGAVMSVAGRSGDVVLTKADVGLSNVDNTRDADKPVSTAQANAIANQTGSTITGLKETSVAMPANDIDLATGNLFTKTITGATTITVSNVPTSGTVGYFILQLTNGGAGAVTYPSGTKWSKGTAPTLTASGIDLLRFVTIDGGTRWEASRIQEDSK